MQPGVEVRRAGDRPGTAHPGVETWHAFSGGRHYDPANTSFGPLVAHDEHLLSPGAGFPDHRHRDVDVVTWVVEGALRHTDSLGHQAVLRPGAVQVLRAGSGVVHSEVADGERPVRFLQAWLLPVEPGLPPSVERREPAGSGLVLAWEQAAGGRGGALHVGRLADGERVVLPSAPRLHLHVATGAVDLDGAGHLETGDAVRLTGAGAPGLTATPAAQVLAWALPA